MGLDNESKALEMYFSQVLSIFYLKGEKMVPKELLLFFVDHCIHYNLFHQLLGTFTFGSCHCMHMKEADCIPGTLSFTNFVPAEILICLLLGTLTIVTSSSIFLNLDDFKKSEPQLPEFPGLHGWLFLPQSEYPPGVDFNSQYPQTAI